MRNMKVKLIKFTMRNKDPQTQSDKDDLESEKNNNIIQFEKYKK